MQLFCFEDTPALQKNVNAPRLPLRSGVDVRNVESELQSKLERR